MYWTGLKRFLLISIIVLMVGGVLTFTVGFYRNVLHNGEYTEALCTNIDYILIEHICYYQCCTDRNQESQTVNIQRRSSDADVAEMFLPGELVVRRRPQVAGDTFDASKKCQNKICNIVCYSGYVQVRDNISQRIWNVHQVLQNAALTRNYILGNFSVQYPLGANSTCYYMTDYKHRDNCNTCVVFSLQPELMYLLIAIGLVVASLIVIVILVRYEIWYKNKPFWHGVIDYKGIA